MLVFSREIKKYMRRRKRKKAGGAVVDDEGKPRWEQDYDLLENEGLFQEYLEMSKLTNPLNSLINLIKRI